MDTLEQGDMLPSEEDARFRARRRLLKMGVYLTPSLLSLTTFLERSTADDDDDDNDEERPRAKVTVRTQAQAQARARVRAR